MRSFLAVLAGFVLWPALWLPFNLAMAAFFPSHYGEDGSLFHPGLLTGILVASVVFSIAAGWLTAALAPRKPMAHAAVLAGINLAIGLFVQISAWSLMPAWYHIPFLALVVPGILAGARLRARS